MERVHELRRSPQPHLVNARRAIHFERLLLLKAARVLRLLLRRLMCVRQSLHDRIIVR